MYENLMKTAALFAATLLFFQTAAAQWPPYPTPNVPRLADGSPDLDGPVPRGADGKPDFSGIWSFRNRHQAGEQGRPIGPAPEPPPGAPPYVSFWDIGYGFENGLPYQPWARELRERRMADNGIDNPDSYCLPLGHMQFHTHLQPRKIIQTPDVIVMLYEASAGVRQIFTDGRALPDNDPLPWWYGYAVGRWEGDTLVVESSHFRENGWLDFNGSPSSEALKITERFTRTNFGTIVTDVTIDDPGAYTEPFTVRLEHDIMLDTNLIEWVCEDEQSTQHFER